MISPLAEGDPGHVLLFADHETTTNDIELGGETMAPTKRAQAFRGDLGGDVRIDSAPDSESASNSRCR
jgi:hypothetical protein